MAVFKIRGRHIPTVPLGLLGCTLSATRPTPTLALPSIREPPSFFLHSLHRATLHNSARHAFPCIEPETLRILLPRSMGTCDLQVRHLEVRHEHVAFPRAQRSPRHGSPMRSHVGHLITPGRRVCSRVHAAQMGAIGKLAPRRPTAWLHKLEDRCYILSPIGGL